jgi:hypothetical protein
MLEHKTDTNLLEETMEALKRHGKTSDDVRWVGIDGGQMAWPFFVELAKDCEYYSSYGRQEINDSLKIVGDDWWMERGEYDGSEWWEFRAKPEMPSKMVLPKSLKMWGNDEEDM